MQRKPGPGGAGFPPSCAIKPPDSVSLPELPAEEQDRDLQHRRRQQLINFAHSQWGFNNWSWAVTKQELDFVDFANGKYSAGVVAFVSITVKSLEISREDIGYASTVAPQKGSVIFQSRKCAVTNALRETLLSFGGNIAENLLELLESQKTEIIKKPSADTDLLQDNNNIANKLNPLLINDPKNVFINNLTTRKDSSESSSSRDPPVSSNNYQRPPLQHILPQPPVKTMPMTDAAVPPVAKAQPVPANIVPPIVNKPATFPANHMPPQPPPHVAPASVTGAPLTHVRPNSNEPQPEPGDMAHLTEEEQRAERRRRQKKAQEDFRIKQLQKHNPHSIDGDLQSDNVDNIIRDIATQDLVEATGVRADDARTRHSNTDSKRKCSDTGPGGANKRHASVINKLDMQIAQRHFDPIITN